MAKLIIEKSDRTIVFYTPIRLTSSELFFVLPFTPSLKERNLEEFYSLDDSGKEILIRVMNTLRVAQCEIRPYKIAVVLLPGVDEEFLVTCIKSFISSKLRTSEPLVSITASVRPSTIEFGLAIPMLFRNFKITNPEVKFTPRYEKDPKQADVYRSLESAVSRAILGLFAEPILKAQLSKERLVVEVAPAFSDGEEREHVIRRICAVFASYNPVLVS